MEDKLDEEDKANEVVAEDEANAHRSHTICRIKHTEGVEEADVATSPVSHSRQEVREQWSKPQRKPEYTIRTSQRRSQTGTYVTRVGLTSKTDTRRSHAHIRGAKQTIKKGSIGIMRRHTSTQDGTRAPRGCIRQNFRDFDSVGRSIK